jgi:hypothetical protein
VLAEVAVAVGDGSAVGGADASGASVGSDVGGVVGATRGEHPAAKARTDRTMNRPKLRMVEISSEGVWRMTD